MNQETFSITISPSPQVNFQKMVVYNGEVATAPVSLSSPAGEVTFSWTAEAEDGITGLTITSGTDAISAETPVTCSYRARSCYLYRYRDRRCWVRL